MGLDVYLYKSEYELSKVQEIEEEYDRRYGVAIEEKIGDKSYSEYTKEEKSLAQDIRNGIKEELNIDELEHRVEIPSTKHPDHFYRIGYFRSSYNSSGFNSVMQELFGHNGLYEIFEPGEEYRFTPDWGASRERCIDAIQRVKEAERPMYKAIPVSLYENDRIPRTEGEAVSILKKNLEDRVFPNYSSGQGDFFLDGITIYAAIPGRHLGAPCVYILCEVDKEELNYLLSSLEVVLETINSVLSTDEPYKYYFHWSG